MQSFGTALHFFHLLTWPQGEPLHNYDATLAAVDILAQGLELSRKKILVSSVGLVPEIRTFLATGMRCTKLVLLELIMRTALYCLYCPWCTSHHVELHPPLQSHGLFGCLSVHT